MIINRFEPGTSVCALYMGEPCVGRVIDSRVKYGGRLQYSVTLDEPLYIEVRDEPLLDILVNHENIVAAEVNGQPWNKEIE
jgi:hypothetical protein